MQDGDPDLANLGMAQTRLMLARTYLGRPEDVRFRRQIRERLDERDAFMFGETPADAAREAHPLLLTGESGAGKSRMAARAFAAVPRLVETGGQSERPMLSVKLHGVTTLKAVGLKLVAELGYPMHPRSTDHAIFARLDTQLALAKTRLLHVDEFQEVCDNAEKDEREPIRNSVKSLVTSERHPVVVVLSGLESLVDFFHEDQQLSRRSWSTSLPRLQGKELEELWKGIKAMAAKVGVAVDDDFGQLLMPRLLHVTNGQLGAAMAFAVEAMLHAIWPIGEDGLRRPREGEPTLRMRDFAAHYHDKTQNADFANPFVERDWHLLDPRRTGILLPSQLAAPVTPPARGHGRRR